MSVRGKKIARHAVSHSGQNVNFLLTGLILAQFKSF
jgi:hypothetical protein